MTHYVLIQININLICNTLHIFYKVINDADEVAIKDSKLFKLSTINYKSFYEQPLMTY